MSRGLSFSLALSLLLTVEARAFAWQVIRHEGRDYVPLRQIAQFYGLPDTPAPEEQLAPGRNRVELDNGHAQLQLTLDSREAWVDGVREWLSFPVKFQDGQLIVSRLDLAKILDPTLRPVAITPLSPVKTVVLDPGHGGHDKGAYSLFGFEKNFALDVAQRVKKELEVRGFQVVMTRSSDVFIPLEQRPQVASRLADSIFVSIHFNSTSTNPLASGFEVFSCTPRGAPSTSHDLLTAADLRNEPGNALDVQSAALANAVHHSLLGHIPAVDRGMKHERFAVIRLATVPAILIEGGFLSSPSESRLIASSAWRAELATSIAVGIESYRDLAEKKIAPKLVADYQRESTSHVTLRDSASALVNPTAAAPSPAPATSEAPAEPN